MVEEERDRGEEEIDGIEEGMGRSAGEEATKGAWGELGHRGVELEAGEENQHAAG